VVALDTEMTPELVSEGLAREFVRRVQDLRKAAGLQVSDRIKVFYSAGPRLTTAISEFSAYIRGETLANRLVQGSPPEGAASTKDTLEGEKAEIALTKD
jgi:isoleucyl-tRNA synthetase